MIEFKADGDGKEYEMEEIWDNAVYAKKLVVGHLLSLYYLIS